MDSTKIIIDNIYTIDLSSKDIAIPISYELIDIKNLNRRSGSKTKTIVVPRTQRNDKIFGLAYSINAKNQFDKYLPREIRIEKNGQLLFNGLCKLTDVTQDTISFYAFSELSKLKELFGQLTLNDLNLDDLEHTYDETIFDTWDGIYPIGVPEDYFYPLIDYGQFQDVNPNNSSENPPIKVLDVYPALYLKRAIYQICSDNGYTLKTTFFDDPQIAKILIPFTNEQFIHSDGYLNQTEGLFVKRADTLPYGVPLTAGTYTIPNDIIIYDTLGQYVSDIYTADSPQRSNIDFIGYLKTIGNYPPSFYFEIAIQKSTDGGTTWVDLTSGGYGVLNYNYRVDISTSTFLNTGDKIRLVAKRPVNGTFGTEIAIYVSSYRITPKQGELLNILQGEPVQIAPNLPPIKQIDLFNWCYKMFNWIIFVDDNKGEIQIYTYDSYYKNDSQKDFSKKISLTPPPIINYQPTDFSRKYDFQYQHDPKDFWLSKYDLKQTQGQPYKYGDGRYYLTEQGEATLIGPVGFSPTIIEKSFMGHDAEYIYIPTMLDIGQINIKNTQHSPRLLINGGLTSVSKLSDGALAHIHVEGQGALSYIPLCYFQKNIYGEAGIDAYTLNLSFSTPDIVLSSKENLIEKYYKNAINSLSVSAQVTAYFKLSTKDIAELDFSQNWYISFFNSIFRLNKIIDFNVSSLGLTKVELINVGVLDNIDETYQEIKPVNNIVYLSTESLEIIMTESSDNIII